MKKDGIRITVNFRTEEELERILELVRKKMIRYKIPAGQKGEYKRAYIFINAGVEKEEC